MFNDDEGWKWFKLPKEKDTRVKRDFINVDEFSGLLRMLCTSAKENLI